MDFLHIVSNHIVTTLSKLGVWYNIIVSIVGVVSIIVLFLTYQMKSRDKILFVYIFAALSWMTYFLLQGDLTSAFMNIIGIIRSLIFMQREKHKWAKSIFWLFFFIAIMLVCAIFTFSTWKDLFPLIGNIIGTISFFVLNEKILRVLNITTYLFWIGNSISKLYYLALVSDSLALVSLIISLIRYRKKKQAQNIEIPEKTKENDKSHSI